MTTNTKKMIISFSLYGNNQKYLKGAYENLKLSREFYSGWTCRFYVSQEISSSVVCKLAEEGAEVITKTRRDNSDGMFWRFLPASENELDILLVRDIDSRLSLREVLAVQEWIESGKGFHIMRDHPYHMSLIMGGMWGCRGKVLSNLPYLVWKWRLMRLLTGKKSFNQKGMDQTFLNKIVYPMIKDDVLIHSEFVRFEGEQVRPFPYQRKGFEFVGEIYNEDGTGKDEHVIAAKKWEMKVRPMPDYRNTTGLRNKLNRLKQCFGGYSDSHR